MRTRSYQRPSPDAALLTLCARLAIMQAEWQRLYDLTSDETALTTPADHAWKRYSDNVWPRTALQPRGSDTLDVPAMLLTSPATTREGLAAKAAAVLALDAAATYCDLRDDSLDLCMSVIRDAAGSAVRPLGAQPSNPIASGAHRNLTPSAPGGSRLPDGTGGRSSAPPRLTSTR